MIKKTSNSSSSMGKMEERESEKKEIERYSPNLLYVHLEIE
jgi:hypothetical protein